MRQRKSGLKLWSLLVGVAIVAVCLAAVRDGSSFAVGAAMVGACVFGLAYRRYRETLRVRQATGETVDWPGRIGLFLVSFALAATIIGLSYLVFLAEYHGYFIVLLEIVRVSDWSPFNRPKHLVRAMVVGLTLALICASTLRRAIWRPVGSPIPVGSMRLWPVFLMILITLILVWIGTRH